MSEEREAEPGRERPRHRRGPPGAAVGRDARRLAGATRAGGTAVRDGGRSGKGSLPSRFVRFLREVVAELRKVIWPTRNQMVTYTIVVLVFVSFMVALVVVLDYLFARGVLAVFGYADRPRPTRDECKRGTDVTTQDGGLRPADIETDDEARHGATATEQDVDVEVAARGGRRRRTR